MERIRRERAGSVLLGEEHLRPARTPSPVRRPGRPGICAHRAILASRVPAANVSRRLRCHKATIAPAILTRVFSIVLRHSRKNWLRSSSPTLPGVRNAGRTVARKRSRPASLTHLSISRAPPSRRARRRPFLQGGGRRETSCNRLRLKPVMPPEPPIPPRPDTKGVPPDLASVELLEHRR